MSLPNFKSPTPISMSEIVITSHENIYKLTNGKYGTLKNVSQIGP